MTEIDVALLGWGGLGGGVFKVRSLPPNPPSSLPKIDLRCPGDFCTIGALWYLLSTLGEGGGEGDGGDLGHEVA
mgnify:CR=1 FL=1